MVGMEGEAGVTSVKVMGLGGFLAWLDLIGWFVWVGLVCAINLGGSGADFHSFLLPSGEARKGRSDKFLPGWRQADRMSGRGAFTVEAHTPP